MEGSHKVLVEELTRRGFTTLPQPGATLPPSGADAIAKVDEALANAELSIHLLGDGAGFTPEGATPIVRLQLDRAAARIPAQQHAAAPDPRAFHRLIWAPRILPGAPDGTAPRDPFQVLAKQAGLPADAPAEQALRPGDKLHDDALAKFVDFVLQHLALTAPAAAPEPLEEGAEVYVQHHEADRGHAMAVARGLKLLNLKPALPALQGAAAEIAAWHRRNLKRCAAVVLCWAKAGDVWVLARADELDDPALGREGPYRSRTVVILPPPDQIKADADLLLEAVGIRHLVDASAVEPTPEALKLKLQPLRG
jgi:hypothetical protein